MKIDWIAAVIACALAAAIFIFYRLGFFTHHKPAFFFSSTEALQKRDPTLKERLIWLPKGLALLGLTLFAIAFIDPHYEIADLSRMTPPSEGMAVYLVLDRSGSMSEVVDHGVKDHSWVALSKFDILQNVAKQFIDKAPNDLIGVVAFARVPQVISPLTLDHKILKERIDKLTVVKNPDDDGTAMGYAIYKTAHLIASMQDYTKEFDEKPPYEIKSAVMIIITDGFQDPSYLDRGNKFRTMELADAAAYAKSKGIRTYIINVDPSINSDQLAPNRHELQQAAEITGGKLVVTEKISDLQGVLDHIQQLEKSRISEGKEEVLTRKVSFFPYFLAAGFVALFLSAFSRLTFWRQTL